MYTMFFFTVLCTENTWLGQNMCNIETHQTNFRLQRKVLHNMCAMECLLYSVAILLDNIVHTYNAWVIISQIYMKRLWPLNSSAIQVLFVQSTKQACCYREGRSYIAYMTIVCPVDFTANTNAHNVRMYTCIWIYILMHITCKYRYESRSHKFAIFWICHMHKLHIRIFYNDLLSFVQHPASYVIVVAWQASSGQLQKVHRNLHIITKYKTDVPAEATCVQR